MTRLMVDVPPLSASIWALRPDGNYRDVNVQRCWTALRRIFREADWMVT